MPSSIAPLIVCPQCYSLILKRERCQNPGCGWQRVGQTEPGALIWSKSLKSPLGNHIINVGAKNHWLCFPTADGLIKTLDSRNGSLVWTKNLDENRATRDVIGTSFGFIFTTFDTRTIVPTDQKAVLNVLNPSNGEFLWSFSVNSHSLSVPVIKNNYAFSYASNRSLIALDLEVQEKYWEVTGISKHTQWTHAAPLAIDSYVILPGGLGFGHNSQTLAFKNGRQAWRFEFGSQYTPVADKGVIGIVTGLQTLRFLDLSTGVEIWKKESPRAFTTEPVCQNGKLFIGAREHRQSCALYAYDINERELIWRYKTNAAVLVPPMLSGDRVYVCDESGMVSELKISSGELCWQISINDHPRTRPVIRDLSVIVGTGSGMIYALAIQGTTSHDWNLADASYYVQEKNWEMAAVSYALREQFEEAGDCYIRANCLREASVMFRENGNIEKALQLAEASGCLELAEPFLRQRGKFNQLGDFYDRLGKYSDAAQMYEEAQKWRDAAIEWEKGREYLNAAKNYLKAGSKDDAGRVALLIEDSQKKLLLLLKAEKYGAAAEILEVNGKPEKALRLYRQSGQLGDALRVAENLQDWRIVADLALELGEYERAANALGMVGQMADAADAYEKAAVAMENKLSHGETSIRVAELYVAARKCLNEPVNDLPHIQRVQRKIEEHARLPRLRLACKPPERIFLLGENAKLEIYIENIGWGPACRIMCFLDSDFAGQDTLVIPLVKSADKRSVFIAMEPHNEKKVGPNVFIELHAQFLDQAGNSFLETTTIFIPIARDAAHAQEMRSNAGSPDSRNHSTIVYGTAFLGPVDQSRHQTDMIQLSSGEGLKIGSSDDKNQPEFCATCEFPLKNFLGEVFCPRCGCSLVTK